MTQEHRIRELLARLARLDASESWAEELNPAQRAVMDYLARANRFSRSPSHVADFLGSTRGTVSQTLKALSAKGYVSEERSVSDKRVVRFDLTQKGKAVASQSRRLVAGIAGLSATQKADLETILGQTLKALLAQNGGRPFGLCRNCRHFSKTDGRPFCHLLAEPLTVPETDLICHEQESK